MYHADLEYKGKYSTANQAEFQWEQSGPAADQGSQPMGLPVLVPGWRSLSLNETSSRAKERGETKQSVVTRVCRGRWTPMMAYHFQNSPINKEHIQRKGK